MKRSWLIVMFVLAVLGFASLFGDSILQQFNPKARPDKSFVALEAAVAPEIASHWEIASPPRLPGPYRRSGEGTSVLAGGNPNGEMVCRVRNNAGIVTEDLRLKSDPAFDQMVVYLDTASGDQTLVVMRRRK
jgi:hypothetical protein